MALTRRRIGIFVATVAWLYIVFPFVVGVFAIGDRDGPKIYPVEYHSLLYMIAYEEIRNEKPRQNPYLDRPWFYGFPRPPRR